MNIEAVLKELRDERDLVEQAILSLERFAASRGRRRGRPPAWMRALTEGATEDSGEATTRPKKFLSTGRTSPTRTARQKAPQRRKAVL